MIEAQAEFGEFNLPPAVARICPTCRNPLIPHYNETHSAFAVRRFCSRRCANRRYLMSEQPTQPQTLPAASSKRKRGPQSKATTEMRHLGQIVNALLALDQDDRGRILKTACLMADVDTAKLIDVRTRSPQDSAPLG